LLIVVIVTTFIMLILEYKLPLNKTLKKDKLIPKICSYLENGLLHTMNADLSF